MSTGLLDVNVLVALADASHEFHETAHRWFSRNARLGWATCPITENGCLRIMGGVGYPYPGLTITMVRGMLMQFRRAEGHEFWPDSISLLDEKSFDLTDSTAKQLTDIYLLGLAVRRSGRLVTFDRKAAWRSVTHYRPENLEVI